MCLCCKWRSDGVDSGEPEPGIRLMSLFVLCWVNWLSHTKLSYVVLLITFSSPACIGPVAGITLPVLLE